VSTNWLSEHSDDIFGTHSADHSQTSDRQRWYGGGDLQTDNLTG